MLNSPPVSGLRPEAMGCSYRGRVTGTFGRARGSPSGFWLFDPAPVPPPAAVVLLLQAASRLPAPDRANAAPPVRARKSRRVAAERRSLGCMVSPILTDWPVNSTYCNDLGDRVKGGGHE